MNVDTIVKKAAKDIVEAFNVGGVLLAASVYEPHASLREAIIPQLAGKVPTIFIERICFVPRRK